MISSDAISYMNFKGQYYDFQDSDVRWRAFYEFLFLIILVVYLVQMIRSIGKKVQNIKTKTAKEEAKRTLIEK